MANLTELNLVDSTLNHLKLKKIDRMGLPDVSDQGKVEK